MIATTLRWLGIHGPNGTMNVFSEINNISMMDDGIFAEHGLPRVWNGVEYNGGSFDQGNIDTYNPDKALEHFGFTEERVQPIVLLNWERVTNWEHGRPWLLKTMDAIRRVRSDTTIWIYDARDGFIMQDIVDGYMISMNMGPGAPSSLPLWEKWARTRLGLDLKTPPLSIPMFHPFSYGPALTREAMLRMRSRFPDITAGCVWGTAYEETDPTFTGAVALWEELIAPKWKNDNV